MQAKHNMLQCRKLPCAQSHAGWAGRLPRRLKSADHATPFEEHMRLFLRPQQQIMLSVHCPHLAEAKQRSKINCSSIGFPPLSAARHAATVDCDLTSAGGHASPHDRYAAHMTAANAQSRGSTAPEKPSAHHPARLKVAPQS
jgi:hypothetical protein